jgi:peptide/nickel transport system ATP-binding protein
MAILTLKSLIIYEKKNKLVDLFSGLEIQSISLSRSLGIVGQSGSGKSLSLKMILNMLPSNLQGNFQFESDFDLTLKNIGFIPQNPFTSLSPMTKISKQFFQPKEIRDYYFELVGLEQELQDKFPVELSGGQLQRVVIAIALSTKPKLLLLDEPTTALDETNKHNILNLIHKLQDQLGFLIIFVSHDITSVESICDNIAIMNKGSICEYEETSTILNNPKNDYTVSLIKSNFENRQFRV